MLKPYSIYLPPFDITSGGIRVMWGLYGALLLKGQIVTMNGIYDDPDTAISIYPEIVVGNPLKSNRVVRYLLNEPGVMTNGIVPSPTSFPETDVKYYFSRLFGETDDAHYMFLPIIDTHVFKDKQKKRDKTAYFVGKGVDKNLHPKNSILIDRRFAQDQHALSDLLNECDCVWVYDPVTAMTEIARLCGTRVVMINPKYTKEQFNKYEPGMNGISWGSDEKVKLDTSSFTEKYKNMKNEFLDTLDLFIEETQKL